MQPSAPVVDSGRDQLPFAVRMIAWRSAVWSDFQTALHGCASLIVAAGYADTDVMPVNRYRSFDGKRLSPAEQNYSAGELELLAVIYALELWRLCLSSLHQVPLWGQQSLKVMIPFFFFFFFGLQKSCPFL